MAVIKKYIEFLREYNKLLERGSKNVYRQKDVLWLEKIKKTSIIGHSSFESLFSDEQEQVSDSLLKVDRPQQKSREPEEETDAEKLDRETYSFLYKAARDSSRDSGLEFVYSLGLFSIKFGEVMVKVHLFNIPLKAKLSNSKVSLESSDKDDPYIDAHFLNQPEINRTVLTKIIEDFDEGIAEKGIAYLRSSAFRNLISKRLLDLHPSLVFDPSTEKPAESLQTNFISFSPCLILRRKRPRHFQKLMDKIISFTDENNPELKILDILLRQRNNMLSNDTSFFTQLFNAHKDKVDALEASDFQTFFPLPYNNEQLGIYENYKTHDLSVVTGPPGTGKSHSIVNLLCAILAEGKRVLITAKTDKALESLLDKIPEQFRGLVMADIQQQNSADYTLSNSIESIRDLLLQKSNYTIDRHLAKLDKEKRKYTEKRVELARLLNIEYTPIRIDYFDKKFDVYELFQFVNNKLSEWGWIKDPISAEILEDHFEIKQNIKELLRLKNAEKKECKLDLQELEEHLNDIDFEKLSSFQRETRELLKEMAIDAFDEYQEETVNLILSDFKNFRNNQLKVSDPVKLKHIQSICNKKTKVYESNTDINCTAKELIENKDRYRRDISTYLASIPEDKEKMPFFKRSFYTKHRAVKYLEEITINDSFCDNRTDLSNLRSFIVNFSVLYKQIDILVQNGFIVNDLNEECNLREMQRQVESGKENVRVNSDLLISINREEIKAFADHYRIDNLNIEKLIEKADELKDLSKKVIIIKRQLSYIKQALDRTQKKLKDIGIEKLQENKDVEAAKENIGIAAQHHENHKIFNSAQVYLNKKVPKTTEHLLKLKDTKGVKCSKDSFHLKSASAKVEGITNVDIQKTAKQLDYFYKEIQKTKAEILSGLGKENFKNRFDEGQKNDFVNLLTTFDREFKQSKRGIKDKEKFRRKAQQTAQKIAPNIACWVMKFDDVLKTIDEQPHVFDCVIVDEASQLDFNSLLLGYYTKKMIVVGDEKQTSPHNISIKDESFNSLREKELSFMGDNAIHIRSDASLFSLSQMVAGTTKQMLKEHFRCVPELIEFSKKHYYNNKIKPLKVISADRLPPKILEYVEDAVVIDKIVKKEIETIARRLEEMLSDSRYEDKTIGVLSLGGAAHTQSLKTILESLPQDKLEKHNIIIDNPSQFQGDERDVIIVSLGVGIEADRNNEIKRPTAIVDNIANNLTPKLRGINVGLSRAKEQMKLFYSVKLDELKENDFRRKIISFFNEEFSPVEPFELPEDLEKSQRMIENRPEPFDSWFEFDIAQILIENGYVNLVPQFEVKKKELFDNPKTGEKTYVHFKIDIVVYHHGMPLAIECDGDIYHSETADVAYDIERQEFLQRIGWKVHRITYSSFKIDPKKEIKKLISFIKRNSPKKPLAVKTKAKEKETKPVFAEESKIKADIKSKVKTQTAAKTRTNKKTSEPKKKNNLTPNIGVDLFSNVNGDLFDKQSVVQVNTVCTVKMLDVGNKELKIILKDIPRNQKPKMKEGIQIVSIYGDLGKIVMNKQEGDVVTFPKRGKRVEIAKIHE